MKSGVASVLCSFVLATSVVSAAIERRGLDGTIVAIPAEWHGRSVRLEQRIAFCELDVKANGRFAGTAYAPDATVELSPFLAFGGENTITVDERPVADFFGRGDGPFGNKDNRRRLGKMELVARTAAYVDDFFVQPSWRERKLTVDVEIESIGVCNGEVEAVVADAPDGPAVVKGTVKCALTNGTNVARVVIPWPDPIPWEPVAHAKTYDCRVTLSVDGDVCDSNRPHALFGFREIWREGKEIYLNGHLQRFRVFWNQGLPKDPNDVHLYGFNVAYEGHKHWAYYFEDAKAMELRSKAGIAVFTGMPSIYFVHDAIRMNPKCTEQFRRSLKAWMRTWRNYPCIVAASCGVNQICPERNMCPEILGQDRERGGVVDNIEFACGIAREMNANCLYYSHADGTEADLSSSNLYFNFTPLQEREAWLAQWSVNGILPWCAVEFGSPYYACWFHSRVPEMTEWLAAYYGDKAYAAEDEEMLVRSKDFAKSCLRFTHGGWVDPGHKDLYAFNSLAEEYSRMLVYRTNRAWRSYGQNGGMMYLLAWPWDRPNAIRDRQMLANGDFVAFIGGDDEPTDRTHAYFEGEKVRKNIVLVWDGQGENAVTATWRIVDEAGRAVADGEVRETLACGDIRQVPIVFDAPAVKARKEAYRIEVAFAIAHDGENPANATCMKDVFDFEVYRRAIREFDVKERVVLVDPEGRSAALFKELGMETDVKVCATIAEAQKEKSDFLIVGERVLSKDHGLEKFAEDVAKGLRILVLQQDPAVWQSLGFTVEDAMARQMFNVSLKDVDDHDLAHWRGEPDCGVTFGSVMKHTTRRGPRGTHRHAVSSTPILIPQRAGFRPLVRGEFDLSYTSLLEERYGEGSVIFCSFDFAGRAGKCPAALAVWKSVLGHLFDGCVASPARVFTAGKSADRLSKALGIAARPYAGAVLENAELVLVGPDAEMDYRTLLSHLGDGRAYVFGNARLADEAGIVTGEEVTVYRVTDCPGFDGIGPSLLRWRDGLRVVRYAATNGFEVAGGGLLARKGPLLFDATDPFQIADRYRRNGEKAAVLAHGGWGSVPKGEQDLYLRNAAQSEDNHLRRLSLMLASFGGVGASEDVFTRSLYTKPAEAFEPISQYNVLGPWPSEKDDSHYMVDTIFPVDESKGGDSGALAEEMAIRGDVQPNPRFYPLGLSYLDETPSDLRFLDWRPVAKSRANGYVDYSTASSLIAAQSFCTCYCVGFLRRREAGEITIRFGVDWRGKLWVNGKAFDPIYGGHKDEGAVVYEHVKVNAGENVITVKAGCGQSVKAFWLNVSHEPREGELVRHRVPELDEVTLYESANPSFDPYEYVYW